MIENWFVRKRPPRLERRVEFSSYEETRGYLDRVADLAEEKRHYPDLSFGPTHVCITLSPYDEDGEVDDALIQYAAQMDALLPVSTQTIQSPGEGDGRT